jgi:capsular polysaccharide biosynthesis protein
VELKEIRASLRRHWAIAVVVLLIIPVVMVAYLVNRDVVRPPARYTTSADVLIPARDIESANPNENVQTVPPVLLQGQPELAASAEVQDTALKAAGLDPAVDHDITFLGRLSEDRTIMTLSVSAPEPAIAAKVLDEYLISYQDGRRFSVKEAALERADVEVKTVAILNRELADVNRDLLAAGAPLLPPQPNGTVLDLPDTLDEDTVFLAYQRNANLNEANLRRIDFSLQITTAAIPGDYSDVVQRRSTAKITPPPPSPLVPLLTILGIGLLLALVIPVLRDRLDPTITEARAAPGALRAGLLGTIPFIPRRFHQKLVPPGSSWDLAFRSLAATSLSTDRLPKALMVTSPTGSAQDRVAANLAASLAGLGVSVALIGTVPRQSWFLADVFDEEDAEGRVEDRTAFGDAAAPPRTADTITNVRTLPDLLQDAEAGRLVGDVRTRLATREIPNLYVIPPGADEGTLTSLDGLPPLLDALTRSGIDICVIAGPALLEDPNATIIAWSTRHVLWAVEMGQVAKADANLAADRIELAGVTPFGIALVNRHALRT